MWRTLFADGDPLESLSVDGQPAARVRRRCHPLCATSSGWCAPNGFFVWRAEHVGHIYCVSLVRRCTMQRNRLRVTQLPDDCIAIVHFFECCNASVQFCTKNCIFRVPFCSVPIWASPRRGGERRHDAPDGRSLAVVIPCAGRGFRGKVLSLVSVYGPVSGAGFDQERRVMFDCLSTILGLLPFRSGW